MSKKKKPEKIEIGIYHVQDMAEIHNRLRVVSGEDLPVAQIIGQRKLLDPNLLRLDHCIYDDTTDPGQETMTCFKKNWVKSAIRIQLILKEGFPEKGERVVKVEV